MRLLAAHIYLRSAIEDYPDTPAEGADACSKAIEHFTWIIKNANKDSKFALYAEFGYAQTRLQIDQSCLSDVAEILIRVRDRFSLDADNRDELRSKATSRTIEYVCEVELGQRSQGELVQLRKTIADLIDRVDNTLTVFNKRNVSQSQFMDLLS